MNTTEKPSPTETIAVDTSCDDTTAEQQCVQAVVAGFGLLLKGLCGVVAAMPIKEEKPDFVDHMGNPCDEYDTLAIDTKTGLPSSCTRLHHPNHW